MANYFTTHWREKLDEAHLGDFQACWDYPGEWFEPPNYRRGGFSGVVRLELAFDDIKEGGKPPGEEGQQPIGNFTFVGKVKFHLYPLRVFWLELRFKLMLD